jgi:Ca2+-binding RTX toxin-like protein
MTAGSGRDRLLGGGGNDSFIDGETEANAASDLYNGGSRSRATDPDPGDTLSYATRRRPVRIDLGRRVTSAEDQIIDVESLVGGDGNDRLTGSHADNSLMGGPGDDVLRGGDGRDIPMGGKGSDRIYGEADDDVLWGEQGSDHLLGGSGDDLVIGVEERGPAGADELACGDGEDAARSDSSDTLDALCETVLAIVSVRPFPTIDGDSADFSVGCSISNSPPSCIGTFSLRVPGGQALGSTRFTVPNDADGLISIPLDPVALAVLRGGTVVQVDIVPSPLYSLEEHSGGYRAFMRAS